MAGLGLSRRLPRSSCRQPELWSSAYRWRHVTLYAIQPAWWRAPIWGIERFLVSNLTREKSVPVTSLYLGTVYRFALPWHNTLVLTAVTTPVAGGGAGASRHRLDPGKSAIRPR